MVAVDDISFDIPRGSFHSFLGPSGCGKTTSLRLIAGFEQPDAGEVAIGGKSMVGVPAYRRPVNMVFQHYALFPHMNVADNVGYGLRQMSPRLDKAEIDKRVAATLEMVRLPRMGARRIWELSGGQQQRVALARALVNRPTVLLLDEPLAALDRKLRRDMQIELQNLQRDVGITFILVTHDQEEALSMSDTHRHHARRAASSSSARRSSFTTRRPAATSPISSARPIFSPARWPHRIITARPWRLPTAIS